MAIPIKAEQVKFTGDYEGYAHLPAGAYVCSVVSTKVVDEKSYLLLCLDVAEGEFAGYGQKGFERSGKDYSFIKVYKSYKDNGKEDGKNPLWFFRQMLARFEEENPGKYQQTDMDEKHLIGLKIGVVLREEEYRSNDGEIKTSVKFYNFAEIKKIRDGKVKTPNMKKLQEESLGDDTKAVNDDDKIPF